MPIYETNKGVQQSLAQREAAAIAPTGYAMIETFEIWHPSLAEPIYIAANPVDFPAYKEADAERDPGGLVTFLGSAAAFTEQEENADAAAPLGSLLLPNVSHIVSQAMRQTRGSFDPWVVIERLYASNDASAPAQLPPLSLLIESVPITGTSTEMQLGYGDPADVSIPVHKFRRVEYPTLQP